MNAPSSPSPETNGGLRRRVVLLGATGSIGESTLRVIEAHADRLELVGIAARRDWRKLAAIAHRFSVPHAALFEQEAADAAQKARAFPVETRLVGGAGGLVELAELPGAEIVAMAVVGTAGLAPSLAALKAGRTLALASKEILVMAGRFVMEAARTRGARILPLDSEHNAVRDCLEGHPASGVRRVVLTASGGAFRDWPAERLREATPAEALHHPNWSMGPKVTVDSATLANKGLELIEARWLFDLKPRQCDAVLHPQSIVHCLVEFDDGVMLAQLSPPSMTFPIQQALLYPERHPGIEPALDLSRLLQLDFRPVDEARFPMLRLARESLHSGGGAPTVYNAANEIAVEAFLNRRITFLAIPEVVEHTLSQVHLSETQDLPSILALDAEARRIARLRVDASKSRT